jgi:hypothetical protein
MKQRLYGFRVLAAAVLAALILSGSATAGKQEPFKGGSSGVVTAVGFDPAKGIAYTRVAGEGQATHWSFHSDRGRSGRCGNRNTDRDLDAHCSYGDMLFLKMTGSGIDPTHGFGEFTVMGGTGRFEGATGSYEQIITFAVPLGTADIIPYTDVLDGTISFGNRS